MAAKVRTLRTDAGPARARVLAGGPRGLLCLGHGAGGGIDAPDLAATAAAVSAAGWTVALVEQPYRVAGRRAPDRAPRLDAAWETVVRRLRAAHPGGPLVVGGRSSGARVACRTAEGLEAAAVVCLAFPLHPPADPQRTRLAELLAVTVPCLVVQGERDRFGTPAEFAAGPLAERTNVVAVPGEHSLRRSAPEVAAVVAAWLGQRVA
jgi:predicted alpha/beta-hydrolase family hydrolase